MESDQSNKSAKSKRKRVTTQQKSFATKSRFTPLSDSKLSDREDSPLGFEGSGDGTPIPDAMLRQMTCDPHRPLTDVRVLL